MGYGGGEEIRGEVGETSSNATFSRNLVSTRMAIGVYHVGSTSIASKWQKPKNLESETIAVYF